MLTFFYTNDAFLESSLYMEYLEFGLKMCAYEQEIKSIWKVYL